MKDYVNGSDLLCSIDTKAVGHCTSHTATFNTETKDVAVKPVATTSPGSSSLYKSKRVTGLSVQVKADGLMFYKETETGFKQVLGPWSKGQSVKLDLFERSQDATPYLTGQFIISNIEQSASAGEDAKYSVTFNNDGPVTVDETKVDLNADKE